MGFLDYCMQYPKNLFELSRPLQYPYDFIKGRLGYLCTLLAPGVAGQYSGRNKKRNALGSFVEEWTASRRPHQCERREVLLQTAGLAVDMMGPISQVWQLSNMFRWQLG